MPITFEQKLKEIFRNINVLYTIQRIDKVIIGRLDDTLIVKLKLSYTEYPTCFDAIEISIINRTEGLVDKQSFRFVDLCGRANNPNFNSAPVSPYLVDTYTGGGGVQWYGKVTKEQEELIRNAVLRYISTFYTPA